MSAKTNCPAGCGKRFITKEHAMSHADLEHPDWIEESKKRKGWVTPYGFADYSRPVTYEQACADMKAAAEAFWSNCKERKGE